MWDAETLDYKYVDIETDYGLYDVEIYSEEDVDEDKERLINF